MLKTNKKNVSVVRRNTLPKKPVMKTNLFRFVLIAVFVGTGFVVSHWFTTLQVFPVKQVRIEGEFNYLDKGLIKRHIEHYSTGGFFDLDIVSLRTELLAMQWVEDAYVRREWPDAVIIRVVEKKPVAKWNSAGVLTAKGHLFFPENSVDLEFMVKLNGPDNRHQFVLSEFNRMQSLLYQADMRINKLIQNERRSWEIETDGIVIKLGRKNIYKKIENLTAVYTTLLKPKVDEIRQIDFRYTNGFSVEWKHKTGQLINIETTGITSMYTKRESNFFIGAICDV